MAVKYELLKSPSPTFELQWVVQSVEPRYIAWTHDQAVIYENAATLPGKASRGRKQWQAIFSGMLRKLMERKPTRKNLMLPKDETFQGWWQLFTTEGCANRYRKHDMTGSKPLRSLLANTARTKRQGWSLLKTLRMGTWNVHTVNQGKLDTVNVKMTWIRTEIPE